MYNYIYAHDSSKEHMGCQLLIRWLSGCPFFKYNVHCSDSLCTNKRTYKGASRLIPLKALRTYVFSSNLYTVCITFCNIPPQLNPYMHPPTPTNQHPCILRIKIFFTFQDEFIPDGQPKTCLWRTHKRPG